MALLTILTILQKPDMNLFTVRPLGKGKYFTLILLKGVVWTFTAVHAVHTTYCMGDPSPVTEDFQLQGWRNRRRRGRGAN